MARGNANPASYVTHFPNFRNVEWNPDPVDIGATIDGAIGQTLNRNCVFDRSAGLWRLQSGDSLGRVLASLGSVNSAILSSSTVVVPAGGVLLVPANASRA